MSLYRYFSICCLLGGGSINFFAIAAEYTCPPPSSLVCVNNSAGLSVRCTASANIPGGWQPISGSSQFALDDSFRLESTTVYKRPLDKLRQGIECAYNSRTKGYVFMSSVNSSFARAGGQWYDQVNFYYCTQGCTFKNT